ncbi:lipopolysaccharide biosynthesis protein [uncultured Vibrio sp.]|uniref:lipopolysaccharide biosynthesis protein n=1 Tax=uncultured Vibrio sp. TaxID=114054 RepID=UPI002AA8836A|nr:lipopolysaccharide biosynthesis protein [uncultured Vibrio sp.]
MKNHYLWAAVERIAPQLVSFGVSIVIARLIGPEAYGLIGMLTIFMALGQAFSELGLSAAIIQRKTITDNDLMSVFVANLIAGMVISLLCCSISPLVAKFYGQDILMPLLCAQSLTFAISSIGAVQAALISREMLFRLSAKVEVASCVLSGGVGLAMAFWGLGVWSLVVLNISRVFVRVGLLWFFGLWRLSGRPSLSAFSTMWGYSSRVLCASLFNNLVTNAYSIIVGKLYPPAALGLYTRAVSIGQIPVSLTGGIVQRVTFPLFSRYQGEKEYLIQLLRKQVRLILAVISPILTILIITSEELIPLLLGDEWAGAIPLLKISCLGGVLYSVIPLHIVLIKALGNSQLLLRIAVVRDSYLLIAVLVSSFFGLQALAWAVVSASFFSYILCSWPSKKSIDYRLKNHLEDVLPTVILCAFSAIILSAVEWNAGLSPVSIMLIKALVIVLGFASGAYVFREKYFHELWELTAWGMSTFVARIRWWRSC